MHHEHGNTFLVGFIDLQLPWRDSCTPWSAAVAQLVQSRTTAGRQCLSVQNKDWTVGFCKGNHSAPGRLETNRYHYSCWNNPQLHITVLSAQMSKTCPAANSAAHTPHNKDRRPGDSMVCQTCLLLGLLLRPKHCCQYRRSCGVMQLSFRLLCCLCGCVLSLQHIKLLAHHHLIKVPAAAADSSSRQARPSACTKAITTRRAGNNMHSGDGD